ASAGEQADSQEYRYEYGEFNSIARAAARERYPQYAERWLSEADRPHRSVEVAPFVTLAFGGRLHARQPACGAQDPNCDGHREVGGIIHLAQSPLSVDHGVGQARDVEHGVCNQSAPGERVADATIKRVRLVLGEADDVRPRLDAGQPAS